MDQVALEPPKALLIFQKHRGRRHRNHHHLDHRLYHEQGRTCCRPQTTFSGISNFKTKHPKQHRTQNQETQRPSTLLATLYFTLHARKSSIMLPHTLHYRIIKHTPQIANRNLLRAYSTLANLHIPLSLNCQSHTQHNVSSFAQITLTP